KNLRFLSPIYAAVALLAAATVRAGLARLRARLPAGIARRATAGVAILLVASLGMDLLRFQEQFVRRDVLDLVTPWLEGRLAPARRPTRAGARLSRRPPQRMSSRLVTLMNESTTPAPVKASSARASSCTPRLSRFSLKRIACAVTQPPAKPPACAQLLTPPMK